MNNRDYRYNGNYNGQGSRPRSQGAPSDSYRQGDRRGAQQGYANPPRRPSGAPQGSRASGQGGRGYRAPSAPAPRRPGVRTYENTYAKKRNTYIILAIFGLVLAAVVLIILLSPKSVDVPTLPAPETDGTPVTTTAPAETEPEPEPVYAEKTDSVVTLSDGVFSSNCIIIDLDNWTVVAEKGGDERIYPASMTKVMTVLIAAEHFDDLSETLTVPAEIIDPLYQANATVAGFFPNEEVTVQDVLYGIILPSGADATGTAAIRIAGSEEEFADLMNEKCRELGLENTHFVNASGLHDDDHYTTPHDMAVIMKAALENELVKEVLGTYTYTTSKTEAHPDGIPLYSTLFSRMEGSEEFDEKIEVFAGKTGYTGEAGQCLVTAARVVDTGRTYIQVCAGSDNKWNTVLDTINNYRHHLGVEYESDYVLKSQR